MSIILRLVIAILIGFVASFFAGVNSPPAKLIVFVGVAAIAFFVIRLPKKK